MPDRFALIIQEARSKGLAHYEADPDAFGDQEMFRACLLLVQRRYPDMEMAVSGSQRALARLALAEVSRLDGTSIPVAVGDTNIAGYIRLTFRPKAGGSPDAGSNL